MISLAEQLINPLSDAPSLRVIVADSGVLEIVREALASVVEAGDVAAPRQAARADWHENLKSLDAGRAQRIRSHIVQNRSGALGLPDIEGEFGMSVGSMQTSFKRTYRRMIRAFIRE